VNVPEMLDVAWSRFRPVGLEELNASAALAQRVDTKYLVPVAVLTEVLERLRPTHACLAIEGRRQFRYSSRYVDSPGLGCYHDHRRGVRKRWKARTRVYEDSGQARFEVKLKDGRGMTVKHALPLDPDAAGGDLTPQMLTFLEAVLRQGYARPVPAGLATTLTVGYRRSTLTQPGEQNRMTVDSDLQMTASASRAQLRSDLALVETKSLSGRSAADQALRAAGVRPCSVSKYCAGMAMLHPALPNHPWRQLLDQHFLSTTRVPSGTGQELAA
jgi:hypothetical protein